MISPEAVVASTRAKKASPGMRPTLCLCPRNCEDRPRSRAVGILSKAEMAQTILRVAGAVVRDTREAVQAFGINWPRPITFTAPVVEAPRTSAPVHASCRAPRNSSASRMAILTRRPIGDKSLRREPSRRSHRRATQRSYLSPAITFYWACPMLEISKDEVSWDSWSKLELKRVPLCTEYSFSNVVLSTESRRSTDHGSEEDCFSGCQERGECRESCSAREARGGPDSSGRDLQEVIRRD